MKKIATIIAILVLSLSCSREPRLVILHVNDTHSHLEPERGGNCVGHGGVIEMAAFVDSVRRTVGEDKVLLLHAGDFSQGSSYYSQFKGNVEVDVLNAMRFDCVTIGNHEFDNGPEDLASRISRLECPVVCANVVMDSLELGSIVRPYAILERGGMKIGIIGLVAPLEENVATHIASRFTQLDDVEVVNRYAAILRPECDKVILLSHRGLDADCALVPEIRGVDIVIGGHSHTAMEKPEYVRDADGRKVPVVQDGCFGVKVGEMEVY